MEVPPVAKVDYNVLRAFLDSHEDVGWKLASPHSGMFLKPVDTNTIMDELNRYFDSADDMGYLYIFSYEFTVSEAASQAEGELPELNSPDQLYSYTVSSDGHDYLYLSPSLVEASNDDYLNLMIFDAEDEEE